MFNFFDKIEDFHRQVFQHHERQIARMFDDHSRHFNIRENRNTHEKREVNFFPAITSPESYCSTKTPKSAPFIVGKSNILAREGISPVKHSDTSLPSTPKSESNIDKGWIVNSSYGTCKILQCGLQTQFEFSPISNAPVSCIYQPKSKLLQGALNDSEYNIKFSIKLMSKPDSATKLTQVKADVRNKYNNSKLKDKLCLLFSFISPEDPYYYLELPFYDDYVKLFKYENKESFLIDSVQNEFLTKIKSNTFSSFDFRVDKISVLLKINENIVFEYNFDKFSENKLNGFIGLLYFGKRCKYAIKEFNLISKDKTYITKTSSSTIENSRLPSSTRLEENKISHNQKQKETIFQPKDLGANISKAAEKLPMHEKKMVYLIMSEIVQRDLGITYDNIAGLVEAKKVIHEAILLPILLPEMFHGIREPWKGCLLFGPPGTGKTLLAKAVSGIEKCTFFNCSSSTLVSKYRGESEKIIRCLFDVARLHSPSVIFIDEVDALVSTRNSDAEHEASRRLKTEFFTQFDGIASTNTSTSVFVLGATNCPWDLDEAVRRRFEKRIYVPLPNYEDRKRQFKMILEKISIDDSINIDTLASMTQDSLYYSSADIHVICREAAMNPLRKMLATKSSDEIQMLRDTNQLGIPKVTLQDFHEAIEVTKPTVNKELIDKYENWNIQFGSSVKK